MKKISLYEDYIEGVFDCDAACWFIVNKKHHKTFIEILATKLIESGCRHFDFVGKYAQKWENIFDDIDIALKPDLSVDNVALTMAWDNKTDFAQALECPRKQRNYIFYDDEKLLNEIGEIYIH